jgi:hypothetical protein
MTTHQPTAAIVAALRDAGYPGTEELERRLGSIADGELSVAVVGAYPQLIHQIRAALAGQALDRLRLDAVALDAADAVLVVIDGTRPLSAADRELLQQASPLPRRVAVDRADALSEADQDEVREWLGQVVDPAQIVFVSSPASDGQPSEAGAVLAALLRTLAEPEGRAAATAAACLRAHTRAVGFARQLRDEQRRSREAQRRVQDTSRALRDRLAADLYTFLAVRQPDSPVFELERQSIFTALLPGAALTGSQAIESTVRRYLDQLLDVWQQQANQIVRAHIQDVEQQIAEDWHVNLDLQGAALRIQAEVEPDERAIALRRLSGMLLGGEEWIGASLRRIGLVTVSLLLPVVLLRLASLVTLIVTESRNINEQRERFNAELRDVIERAAREYLSESSSISVIRPVSLLDLPRLRAVLSDAATPLARHLHDQLAPRAQSQLNQLTAEELCTELNVICDGPLLYTPDRFASVALSEDVREALEADQGAQTPEQAARLNRLLLADAYPSLITRSVRDQLELGVELLMSRMLSRMAAPAGNAGALERIDAPLAELWSVPGNPPLTEDMRQAAEQLWGAPR